METRLAPCPFCGGGGCGGTYGDMHQCARCGAECGFDDNDNQNWNTRPIEAAKDATIERMRGLLREAFPHVVWSCETRNTEITLIARIEAELKEGE